MAEEVEIVNVEGGRGPAAEATLLTLLSEVKKRNLADGIEQFLWCVPRVIERVDRGGDHGNSRSQCLLNICNCVIGPNVP